MPSILINLLFLMVIACIMALIYNQIGVPEPWNKAIKMLFLFLLLVLVYMMAVGRLVLVHL